MGARHRTRFEACGVHFVQVVDIGESVANHDVDFAVVAAPASTHYGYVKDFLLHKVPVFVEKPLALTGAEAQELVDLAKRQDTPLFVAQSECFNPLFLNFRKHFTEELRTFFLQPAAHPAVRLEFRREHRYSPRCRDVDVSLDLLVHDLSLFFTLFKFTNVEVEKYEPVGSGDAAKLRLRVARGAYKGVIADFYVNRNSDCDVRTITVEYSRQGETPKTSYTVSLARYMPDGEIAHVPDSLDNEHRFFLKLLAGACADWGRRLAQTAADAVKVSSLSPTP